MYEAYVLGALDTAERTVFEAHLATGCQECAKALEEARWLVSQLAHLAPGAAPSEMLKGRLMQTVRAEAQLAGKRAVPPKSSIPLWMWVGVAALLLFSVYSAWNAERLRNDVRATNERAAVILQQRHDLEAQLENAKREAVILTDPRSVKIIDPKNLGVEAMWHSKLGIVVTGQRVAAPAGNRVYQLWLIPKVAGGKPIPSLVVRPDEEGKIVLLVAHPPDAMDATKALAITEEPEGGSQSPTTTPSWVGGIR
jgi:anti-sigma-K factor RskA